MDGELRKEMSALVKLNLTAGIANEIYAEEYNRIGQTESFQSNRPVVTDAAIMRRETLCQVWEIDKALRETGSVQEFDQELFGMLVERIRVINLVQVEFVLRSGVGVVEVI